MPHIVKATASHKTGGRGPSLSFVALPSSIYLLTKLSTDFEVFSTVSVLISAFVLQQKKFSDPTIFIAPYIVSGIGYEVFLLLILIIKQIFLFLNNFLAFDEKLKICK